LEIPRNNKNENSLQSPAGVSKRGNSINKHPRRVKSGGGVLESNFFFSVFSILNGCQLPGVMLDSNLAAPAVIHSTNRQGRLYILLKKYNKRPFSFFPSLYFNF
jgi:hypothetical protein